MDEFIAKAESVFSIAIVTDYDTDVSPTTMTCTIAVWLCRVCVSVWLCANLGSRHVTLFIT